VEVLSRFGKKIVNALATVSENFLHIASHFHPVDQTPDRSEGHPVPHDIFNQRSFSLRLEAMRVMPEGERSRELRIRETVRWIPRADFGRPSERYSMQTEAVADQRARLYVRRADSQNVKTQGRRRETFQIRGIRKERKDFIERARHPLAAAKSVKAGQSLLP